MTEQLRTLLEEYVSLGWGEHSVSKELYKAAKEAISQSAAEDAGELVERIRTYDGGFGYEISGDTMYIGPMRADCRKVADIICTIDWDETYTDEAKVRRLQDAERICTAFATLPALPQQPVEYLKVLEDECWDLRCVSNSEDDYHWIVIGHWMAQPQERQIGFGITAIDAIKDAMRPRDYDGKPLDEDEYGMPLPTAPKQEG